MSPLNQLQQIEEVIRQVTREVNASEVTGLRARWESGRILLKGRQRMGGRLPNRALKKLTVALSVHASELTARMKFAEKFSTEEELTNVISKFGSWYAVKQNALTDTPRGKKVKHPLHRILALLEAVDTETIDRGDFPLLARVHELVGRLEQAVVERAA